MAPLHDDRSTHDRDARAADIDTSRRRSPSSRDRADARDTAATARDISVHDSLSTAACVGRLSDWRMLLVSTSTLLPVALIGAMIAVGRLVPAVVVLAASYVGGLVLIRRRDIRGVVAVGVPSALLLVRHAPSLIEWTEAWSRAASTAESLTDAVVVPLAAANLAAVMATSRRKTSGIGALLVSSTALAVLAVVVVSAAAAGIE